MSIASINSIVQTEIEQVVSTGPATTKCALHANVGAIPEGRRLAEDHSRRPSIEPEPPLCEVGGLRAGTSPLRRKLLEPSWSGAGHDRWRPLTGPRPVTGFRSRAIRGPGRWRPRVGPPGEGDAQGAHVVGRSRCGESLIGLGGLRVRGSAARRFQGGQCSLRSLWRAGSLR